MAPSNLPRRRFLAALGGGTLLWPRALAALDARWSPPGGGPAGRGGSGGPSPAGPGRPGAGEGGQAAFWQEVRSAFSIPHDRIYLNNGTLGPQPDVVVEAVEEHTRRVAATLPPALDWPSLKEALAATLGGDPDGFVVPRNTTEAMNVVANGLELGPGDEVVTTDHEHIGGRCPWELVTARRRARLIRAALPADFAALPDGPALDRALEEAVWSRVSSRTRVVSVSHVLFTNGALLPVQALARRCRERGLVFVVDGAHPPGLLPLDIGALGVDFYASSPHKWLLAPQGTGLLWMHERWRERLWPTLASGGWDGTETQRFNQVGTVDESRMAGLLAALAFYRTVGPERIAGRVAALQSHLRRGLGRISGIRVRSPVQERTAGMVSFTLDGVDGPALQRWLAREARVRTRVIGEFDLGWMRLSTHYYNDPDELDRVLALVDRAARAGIPADR